MSLWHYHIQKQIKHHKGNLIDDRLLNVILKLGKMVVYHLLDSIIVALVNCNGLHRFYSNTKKSTQTLYILTIKDRINNEIFVGVPLIDSYVLVAKCLIVFARLCGGFSLWENTLKGHIARLVCYSCALL